MSPIEMTPELQGHGSVTRFLRTALFRKCPLGGRHSVLVTAGSGGVWVGESSGRMWITGLSWLSTYCTQRGAGALQACHLRPPHGGGVGDPLTGFLRQETRERHQAATGSPGSQAHVTHSRSMTFPHPCQGGTALREVRWLPRATQQGEWPTPGFQKPGPRAPQLGSAHHPLFYFWVSWERRPLPPHLGVHFFSPVLSPGTGRPQNKAQHGCSLQIPEQPQ